MSEFRSSDKTLYSAKYHVIWCPKYRRRGLVGAVAKRLEAIIGQMVAGHGGDVLGLEVMPDRVHLLVEVPPAEALSRLLQLLKGRSSRRLCQEFPTLQRLPALWSPSRFVWTVGGAPLHVVKRYIASQKQVA